MIKKNIVLLVVLAVLVATTIFGIVVMGMLLSEDNDTPDAVPETQEGESIGMLGKYEIHEPLPRADIQKILIHNSLGEYAFVRDKSGNFVIEGMEDLPYNEKYFSALISIVGNPLALEKVSSDSKGYKEYGIADSDVYWEVTSTAGKVYRMTVGHMIHTGGGYYVAYAERDAVYVLGGDISTALGLEEKGTSLDLTVLKPVEFYVTPVLIAGIDTNDFYTMDKLTLFRDGEMFMSTRIVDKSEQINPDAIVENMLTFPAEYQVNGDIFYQVLQKIAGLTGTSTVKAGITEDADFDKYGLAEPKHMLSFYYKDEFYTIIISEKQEDGSYFASSTFNPTIVVKLDTDSIGFVDEPLMYWISPNPFNYSITSVEKISVMGKNSAFDFYLRHGVDENKKATLVVDAANPLTDEHKTIAESDKVWDFRSAYRTALYSRIEDDAPLTKEQIKELTSDESKRVLTFEYTLTSGTTRTLEFWQYSTRRTLLTINGEGQYYVYLDRADKIIGDFEKVWRGETVDSHAKN